MTNFRKKRLEYGLSQSQAAKIMNRPTSTVAKWDAGFSKCPDRIIEEFELRFNDANKKH